MRHCRTFVITAALVTGIGVGCATSPPQAPATTTSSTTAASGVDSHAHHAHHARVVQAHSDAPTSFENYPEVGTEFTCPVSGGLFEVESHTRVSHYEGRYYAFCCGGCQQDFDTDPASFVEALRSAAN